MSETFETMNQKLAAIRLLNDLLRAAGHPPAHELPADSPLLKIYYCVEASPIVPTT